MLLVAGLDGAALGGLELIGERVIRLLERGLVVVLELAGLADDNQTALEKAYDSFTDQFETTGGGSIKAGHEEFDALADEDVEQEQIVKQKRG